MPSCRDHDQLAFKFMFFKKTNGNKTITNFIRMAAKKKIIPASQTGLALWVSGFQLLG
jgi:hypothetical protein